MAKIKELMPLSTSALNVIYNNELLIPDNVARKLLKTKYGNFSVLGCDDSADFLELWGVHEELEGYNLFMELKALNEEYNPLANVDITETTTTNFGATSGSVAKGERIDTASNTQNVTTGISDNVDTTNVNGARSGSTTNKKNNYPADGLVIGEQNESTEATCTDTSKVVTTNKTTNRGRGSTTTTTGASTDTTTTQEHTDTMTRHKVGNEGVSITTQFLIQEELKVRENEVRSKYIKKFIKEYGYLVDIY